MSFRWDSSAGLPEPGQFLTLRSTERTAPLLRRPFALSSFDKQTQTAAIIYQIRGSATRLMKEKRAGEYINIASPFGNAFTPGPQAQKNIIVAGGIRLGPVLYLTSWLLKQDRGALFIFGCRDESLVPDTEVFKAISPVICTDDGSRGFMGTTLDYLKTLPSDGLTAANRQKRSGVMK